MPSFGSNISAYLFEPLDSVTKSMIEEEIIFSLTAYEPRVVILSIDINDNPDNNSIGISLDLEIITPVRTNTTLEFIVQRLR
jgi:phage baseplate assembly protein W